MPHTFNTNKLKKRSGPLTQDSKFYFNPLKISLSYISSLGPQHTLDTTHTQKGHQILLRQRWKMFPYKSKVTGKLLLGPSTLKFAIRKGKKLRLARYSTPRPKHMILHYSTSCQIRPGKEVIKYSRLGWRLLERKAIIKLFINLEMLERRRRLLSLMWCCLVQEKET